MAYVIATGVQYSVRDFIRLAALELGIEVEFKGTGVEEKAIVSSITGDKAPGLKVGDIIVEVDPRYFRPAEVETLLGDPTYAKTRLGWTPETSLDELIKEMIDNDLKNAQQHALLKSHGYTVNVSVE